MTAPAAAASWPADCRDLRLPIRGATLRCRVIGDGPPLLLLHGTGTAGTSFLPLVPALAAHRTCLIPDLPGHDGSSLPSGDPAASGIEGMALALETLCSRLRLTELEVAGHSAGAVVGVRLALGTAVRVTRLVGLAPALWLSRNPRQSPLWPLVARISRSRVLAQLLSRAAGSPAAVARIAASTGSALPAAQLAAYADLARSADHLHAMLAMMAAWDLGPIQRAASQVRCPVVLVGGARDPWFPAANLAFQASLFAEAVHHVLPDVGHFLHEERPALVLPYLLGSAA